jgi:hypothetical protein
MCGSLDAATSKGDIFIQNECWIALKSNYSRRACALCAINSAKSIQHRCCTFPLAVRLTLGLLRKSGVAVAHLQPHHSVKPTAAMQVMLPVAVLRSPLIAFCDASPTNQIIV